MAARKRLIRALFEQAERDEISLYLPTLVVAEIVWVLRSFYGHGLSEIDGKLSTFLTAAGLEVEELEIHLQALHLAHVRNVDFVDAYLAVRALGEGATVCTFDASDFGRLPADWIGPGAAGRAQSTE